MYEWNEWMKNGCMNEMNEWIDRRMDKQMNGRMNEWTSGWMNEWIKEWMNEWMHKWMDKWLNEWIWWHYDTPSLVYLQESNSDSGNSSKLEVSSIDLTWIGIAAGLSL